MGPITFGVAAVDHGVEASLERFCDALSGYAGLQLQPRVFSAFQELIEEVAAGRVQLAWVAPLPAVELIERGVGVPLAAPQRGLTPAYHAALFTRADSRFQALSEIENASVAWVSKDSASGFHIPRMRLEAEGMDLGKMFRTEAFFGNHRAVAEAVLGGAVDIGATHAALKPGGQELSSAPWLADHLADISVRVLLLVGPVPGDVLAVSPKVDVHQRQALSSALIALPPDCREAAERVFRCTSFDPVAEGHFRMLRKLARRGRIIRA